jgi:hypothetical protein
VRITCGVAEAFSATSEGEREREYVQRGRVVTSLNRMMLGCRSDRWLMISRCTFSSICNTSPSLRHLNKDAACEKREGEKEEGGEAEQSTFSPRSMYLTATSSPEARVRMRRATPKLPDPMSRTCSYRSPSCIIGISIASGPVLSISPASLLRRRPRYTDPSVARPPSSRSFLCD